jgi:hypothetical protein
LGQVLLVPTRKTIVPVGLLPPAKVAVSEAEPPTVIGVEESLVVKVGVMAFTTSGSQALVTALLLASPLYVAYQ